MPNIDPTQFGAKVVKTAPGVDPTKFGAKIVSKPVGSTPAVPAPATDTLGSKIGNAAKGVFNFFTGATQRFGKTVGESLNAPKAAEMYGQDLQQHTDLQNQLIKAIQKKKDLGQDTSVLESALQRHLNDTPKLEDYTGDVINKTTGQVLGEAAAVVPEVLQGGLLGKEAEIATAADLSTGQKFLRGAKVAAPYGVVGGGAEAAAQGGGPGEVAKGAITGGAIAGLTGGALDVGVGKISSMLSKNVAADESKISSAVGQILQGEEKDIAPGLRVLSEIDRSKVKTYEDLVDQLTKRATEVTRAQDELLGSDTSRFKLPKLSAESDVGGTKLKHNYVNDALKQLDDFYKSTNDVEGAAKIKQFRQLASKEGLTSAEVNDLAKLHGQELNAYNANNELASGLKKQSAENTRQGLKDTVRQIAQQTQKAGDRSKALDKKISEIIHTRDLAKELQAKVNALEQKIQKRSLGNQVGRAVGQVANFATRGAFKGFFDFFLERGQGLKTLNALDLEKKLSSNLRLLDKVDQIINNAKPGENVLQLITRFLNQNAVNIDEPIKKALK